MKQTNMNSSCGFSKCTYFTNKKRENVKNDCISVFTLRNENKSSNNMYLSNINKDENLKTNYVENNSLIGLKDISKQVMTIIKTKIITSYKEISDIIIEESNVVMESEAKNIRRRIYDALNVLKAMNIFKSSNTKKILFTSELNKTDEIKNEELDLIKERINEKLKLLEKIKFDRELFLRLIKKNKFNNIHIEECEKFYPPFFVITWENMNIEDKMHVVTSERKNRVHISSNNLISIQGDYSIIKEIFLKK